MRYRINCRWDDVSPIKDCCSEQVEIIFSALRSSILEIGDRAFGWQARNVTGHIIEIVCCLTLRYLSILICGALLCNIAFKSFSPSLPAINMV